MLGALAVALIAFVLIVPRLSEAEEADLVSEAFEQFEEEVIVEEEESGGFFASIGAKLAPLFDDTAKQKSEELTNRESAVFIFETELIQAEHDLTEKRLAHEKRVNTLISCVAAYEGSDPL